MPDLEQQLEEASSPLERMKLIAESSQRLSLTNYHRAVELVDEALPLARKQMKHGKGRREYALLMHAFGFLCYKRGENDQAGRNFEEALLHFERLNDRWQIANTVHLLGAVAASLCD